VDRIRRLRNPIQNYVWGSRTAIADFLGRPSPASEPEAELWMGAHPAAPSEVERNGAWVKLPDRIAADPEAALGSDLIAWHGPKLPFLFKLLAPERALSIQTHPNAEQARRGFERENAAGLALDDPRRNYRDPHPKPELIVALTRFDALCGFRPVQQVAAGFTELALSSLADAVAALRSKPDAEGLRRFVEDLLTRTPDEQRQVAEQARSATRTARAPEHSWVQELARQYPGNIGVIAPLLLNLITLEAGQGLFLAAGELHAYLRGLGVELMASSDNVLRGGLTPKHVDVPELLSTLTFRLAEPEILEAQPVGPGVAIYATPAREFQLAVLRPREGAPIEVRAGHGVEILLATVDPVQIHEREASEPIELEPGAAVFVPAAAGGYRIEGEGVVFRAGVPA